MRTTRRPRSIRRHEAAEPFAGTLLSLALRDVLQTRLGLFLLAHRAPQGAQTDAVPRWTRLAADPLLRRVLDARHPQPVAPAVAAAAWRRGEDREVALEIAPAPARQADAELETLETAYARLRLSEQLARVRVEALERRARLSASVGRLLEASPEELAGETASVLSRLVCLLVPSLSDFARIDLLGQDGALELGAVVHNGPARRGGWVPDGAPALAARVIRSGAAVVAAGVALDDAIGLPEDVRSAACLPLQARGRTLGVLTLAAVRGMDVDDVQLATDVARGTAVALDNARRFVEVQAEARCREQALAAVSHEMRSPLQVISIASSALLRAWPADASLMPERRQIAVIAQSADRMRRLTADLLDVTQMDAGRFAVSPEPVRVGVLLHSALELHRPVTEQKGISLAVSPFPALTALVDEERVHQVFANLIGNAVRFTPAGGTITLSAEAADGAVRFSVTDTGSGIAEENLPRVFERFFRGDRGRGCAGLGLAISRSIVEAHGGAITVDSQPGQGTTFSFTLPLAGA
jgi:signal transduction histidine kinase